MRYLLTAALAASVLAVGALAGCSDTQVETAEAAPAYTATQYASAVRDIARTDADRASDASRKPGELLAFAQIDRGEVVGDYIMGGGYVTRLLAMAVGAGGRVYAFQPEEFIGFRAEYATEQDAAVAPYGDAQGNPGRVLPLRAPIAAPGFPQGELDTIITVMNLHDLWLTAFPDGTAQRAIGALYAALKPGGKLVVVDHRAPAGSGTATAQTLHRMDQQAAIAALTAAGFELEEESDLYARPDDPRTANVFEDGAGGESDQFALRFVKPA